MNLFRSMCCLFGGRCAEDQPPAILVKGKLNVKRPARTNLDTWKAVQPPIRGVKGA